MFTSRRVRTGSSRPPREQAEAALVDQYTRLVSLAYLTLPASFTRHRRVLLAHGLVQRALPGVAGWRSGRAERVPAQRTAGAPSDAPSDAEQLHVRVLRAALALEQRPRGWPKRLPPPRALLTLLPVVWGLRMFPRAGGAEEIALGSALGEVSAAARAAFVLRRLVGLPDGEVLRLLRAAGESHPRKALRASYAVDAAVGAEAETLLRSQEFDACSVQTRPTDLLRRRRRLLLVWGLVALMVVSGVLLVAQLASVNGKGEQADGAVSASAKAPGPDDVARAPGSEWADTSRVDFTAWPARGERTDDRALLTRALRTWATPPAATRVVRAPGVKAEPPGSAPQLLYAGDVDERTVVVFHDQQRLVHYSETSEEEDPALSFARADDADVTTAAAVALGRTDGRPRYLMAPWIVEAQSRDLLRPDTPARALDVGDDGIAAPVRGPSAAGACDSWPVLQLRSSSRIVEKHAFLVTDLGGLTPAHLSYTPLPGNGVPARQPREATSSAALTSWARTACRLTEFRDDGVRAVNAWDFAAQDLPQDAGRAVWSCTRATTWRGPGHVLLQFKTPGRSEPAPVVARARSTAACSRFGQHVVASTQWTAPSGTRYLLAAGSREVTGITVSGALDAEARGRTLAEKSPEEARPRVRARLDDGSLLAPVGVPSVRKS